MASAPSEKPTHLSHKGTHLVVQGPLIPHITATFFADPEYQGDSEEVGPIEFPYPVDRIIGDNRIGSVKVPPGLKVTLHEHADGSGDSRVLTEDTGSLGDFNNKTSSVTVEEV
jgi:hypothetical protein